MARKNTASTSATILIVFLLFYSNKSFAQKVEEVPYKKFAIEAGANFSNMNFNKGVPPPSSPVPSSWMAGISVGISLKVPLAQNLFLEPGYFYIHRNGMDESANIKYSNDYCSLPVLLKYKIFSFMDVVGGPQAELLIHANASDNATVTNITNDVEERSIIATVGFDVHVIPSFYIATRYLQGLNHIGIGQRSVNVKEFKYESASLTIGFEF